LKDKEDIVAVLGSLYEHSPWVAERFYDEHIDTKSTEITNVQNLFQHFSSIVDNASRDEKLALLRAHPDLSDKAEKMRQKQELTQFSKKEQASAGLNTLTDKEGAELKALNTSYKQKFGFPFILAARNVTKDTILGALKGRIHLSEDMEFAGALHQVHKIAWMRLLDVFSTSDRKGFLTCHVLDTMNGTPAANMKIQLRRITPVEHAGLVKEFITNDDGRLDGPALKGDDFIVGTYEWLFFVGDYFAQKNAKTSAIPFLNEVPLRFGINDPEEHYHVPLLVSPWSYSTYRGS